MIENYLIVRKKGNKNISSHYHYNHSKTKTIKNNEKYINNINKNSFLSKSKAIKIILTDNNETELSLKKDNTSLKENIFIKFILIVINL